MSEGSNFLPSVYYGRVALGRVVSVPVDQLERVEKEIRKDEEEGEDCTLEHQGGDGDDDQILTNVI